VLLQHVLALDRQRFAPEVLAIDPQGKNLERYLAAGVPVVGPPAGGHGYLKVLRFRRMLAARCASGDVDLVHAWIELTTVIGPQAARAGGVPAVASQRNLGYWLGPVKRQLYRWSNARYVEAMVVNSDAIRRRLLEERLCPEERIHVVRNGVDLERFQPAPDRQQARASLGLVPDLPLIGIVGTLKALKGQRDFVQALAELAREGAAFQAVLVGDGPDRQALEAQVRETGLDGRVRFLGRRSDLEALYPAMDVAVLCSRTEGLPNVCVEALACGCAQVVTPVGGVPEVVRDGIEGLHYAPGDTRALAGALRTLLLDGEMRQRMGRAGRERALREFGWETMQRGLEKIYEAVLSGGLAGRRTRP
jgi:glycosyltransferase involved in cell wall biosynthesis